VSFPKYPKYKDSGLAYLGAVPDTWNVIPLKRLLRKDGYKAGPFGSSLITSALLDEGEILVLTPEHVNSVSLHQEFNRYLPPERENEMKGFKVVVGDVILPIVGSLGRALVIAEPVTAIINQRLARISPDKRRLLPHYLKTLLTEDSYFKKLDEVDAKGAIIAHITKEILLNRKVALPSPTEQHLILSFLDRETAKIDALLSEQRQLIELLNEKRQAVITYAVTKGLNPHALMKSSGIEWLGDVPEHWRIKRLKHVSPFITVGIVVNPSTFVSGDGPPFIYGGDIREGMINWKNARRIDAKSSEANPKTRLNAGDLLTVRVGAPGVTAVVPFECEGGNCASVMLIRRGEFNSRWLCYAMNSRMVRFQVEVVQYGAAQEQFNISHAVNFWVPTQPRNEQDDIANFLDRETAQFDNLICEAERAIDILQERRIALIAAAVTGKVDVRGPGKTEAA
jgi:type I restriction enzyme S subunit